MQHFYKIILILLELILIPGLLVADPYCYKNVTEISYKTITKTRLKSVNSKNFFKKIISKKDTQVEVYEDQEPVNTIKLESYCCEGYELSEYGECAPLCVKNGCPLHSKCVEPEVCECEYGYFSVRSAVDGKHFCEPICKEPCPKFSECVGPNQCACTKGYHYSQGTCKPFCASGCPYDGVCVEPNKCFCKNGYKAAQGSCVRSSYPVCFLGDNCQNGRCVTKYRCKCNTGFYWNSENSKCEEHAMGTTDYADTTEYSEFTDSTDSPMEVETDIETSNENIDPREVFEEILETTTHEAISECPADYVYHKGQCRPRKFVTNEIDCWLKPCTDKNAVCLENGTCVCQEGFKKFTTHVADETSLKQTIETDCLTEIEYEARLKELKENNMREPINWISISFIIVGCSILVAALVFFGVKLLLRQTGEIDVEGKNLSCSYNKRACSETEKSVI